MLSHLRSHISRMRAMMQLTRFSGAPHFKEEAIALESLNKQEQKTTTLDEDNIIKEKEENTHHMPHPIWSKQEVKDVKITHQKPVKIGDYVADFIIKSLRFGFDVMSGYQPIFSKQNLLHSERQWVNRIIFLETVAGVPGFVAAMHRHLRSLRRMKRDRGWIHTLLEEAENERMHLMTFIIVKQPSNLFRAGVVLAQFYYVAVFMVGYQFFPRICHRVVGYLEEEAVKTYTHLLEEMNTEGSPIAHWKTTKPPEIAIEYWKLTEEATLEDLVLAVRKDEEHHKIVNHKLADDYSQAKKNPFPPGY